MYSCCTSESLWINESAKFIIANNLPLLMFELDIILNIAITYLSMDDS